MLTDEEREAAAALFATFSSKAMQEMTAEAAQTSFCKEIGGLALENVFSRLWLRPGLDKRSRSLVTLGMLIALRATDELKVHTLIALANGLTVPEIEEVIYHATGYAGFPSANAARAAAADALKLQGAI
jgi:4-carboxymuconolactone decarboxylase